MTTMKMPACERCGYPHYERSQEPGLLALYACDLLTACAGCDSLYCPACLSHKHVCQGTPQNRTDDNLRSIFA